MVPSSILFFLKERIVRGKLTGYNTRQREAIVAYLRQQSDRYLTAAHIAAHFAQEKVPIGRTTLYRQLDKLLQQGLVEKYFFWEDSRAYFQYAKKDGNEQQHIHLKCQQCGKVMNLKQNVVPRLYNSVLRNSAFEMDIAKTVLYGKCGNCANKTRL